MAPGLGTEGNTTAGQEPLVKLKSTAEFESHIRARGGGSEGQTAGHLERNVASQACEPLLAVNSCVLPGPQQKATCQHRDRHNRDLVGSEVLAVN